MKQITLLSWSSGKDCSWALHLLRKQSDIDLVGLFCTINEKFDRAAMHAVRTELVKLQAESVGLPVEIIPIPNPCSNEEYAAIMEEFVGRIKQQRVECIAFGDLYLEDVRQYRVDKLAGTGITPIFPLWKIPTNELSREMIRSGVKTKITCVDPKQLSSEFCGREYDESFLNDLPPTVDPCGENGEFHSFVYDGPMFKTPVPIRTAETVTRDGFTFTDIVLKTSSAECPK